MKLSTWLFLCLITLCAGCVWRYTLAPAASGRVIDAESRAPIADAKVWFKRYPERSVKTDFEGRFRIEALTQYAYTPIIPAETWVVGEMIIEHPDYDPLMKTITKPLFEASEPFELKRSPKKGPNQALLPTPTAVTPAASHPSRQP